MMMQVVNNQMIKEFYRKTKLIQKKQNRTIWEVTHIYNGDVFVSKVQPLSQTTTERTVLHEGRFLQTCQGSLGIPFLVWCGKDDQQKQAILIVQKLGKTLRNTLTLSNTKTLSLKSVCMIGIQLIKMIACYHQKGYIHRNINIDSVQFGTRSRCDMLYFNDLTDSRSFYKKNTLQHIDRKTSVRIKKGSQFSSYDTLDGVEPSRKDDIESIMLVLIYLFKGQLPWSQAWRKFKKDQRDNYFTSSTNIDNNNQQDNNQRNKIKLQQNKTSFYQSHLSQNDKKLFQGQNVEGWNLQKRINVTKQLMERYPPSKLFQGLPKDLLQIYLQVKNLQFTSRPNYQRYCQKLEAILIKKGIQNDGIFDWMKFNTVKKPINKGGLSVKRLEWLIKENNPLKTVQMQNEKQALQIYQKLSPFIQIDKLGAY